MRVAQSYWLVFLCFLVGWPDDLQAQKSISKHNWQVGLEGGFALTYTESFKRVQRRIPTAIRLGVYVQYQLSHRFAIRSGILYTNRHVIVSNGLQSHVKNFMPALNIPLLGVYFLTPSLDFTFGLTANYHIIYQISPNPWYNLQLAARIEIGLHLTKRLRAALYYAHMVMPYYALYHGYKRYGYHRQVFIGISCTYRLNKSPIDQGILFADI